MWATAFAQAVIPWFVFWPLFILTQVCIWSMLFIGFSLNVLGNIGVRIDKRRYDKWAAVHGEAWYKMYPNETLEQYKSRILR